MRHPLWLGPHSSLGECAPRRPLARARRPHPALLAALLPLGFVASQAQAGEVEEANGRLIDLQERVRVLSSEFRDTPIADPTQADRRVLDAELLFNLKNYREAATVLLDVVDT